MLETLQIDSHSLILGGVLLLLALVSPLLNPFFRIRKHVPLADSLQDSDKTDEPSILKGEPVTLLVTVSRRQCEALQQHLPQLLQQQYEPGFKVIVVAEKGDSDTEDIINSFSDQPHFYATYVPQSSRYMSRKKLAVTLGVKAAQTEWIVMTDATCAPSSDHWLASLAEQCTDERNLVIGYANYDDESPAYYRFDRLQSACYLIRETERRTAYRAIGPVVAFRKSEFIAEDGFRGHLQFIRGEYDYMVNKYAQRGKTAVVTQPDAWTIEDAPTRKEWRTSHIYYMHTRKNLARTARHRLLPTIDQCALHLSFLAIVGTALFAALTSRWLLCAIAVIALLLTAILRTTIVRRISTAFGEQIAAWCIYPYELSNLWHALGHRLRYHRADQFDFTTHKI